MMKHSRLAFALSLVLATAAAHATTSATSAPPPATETVSPEQAAAHRAQEANWLAAAESLDSMPLRLLIARMQLSFRSNPEMTSDPELTTRWQALRADAVAHAGDDPLMAQLILQQPGGVDAKVRAHASTTLLDASRRNAYFGLALMAQPELRDDVKGRQQLLHVMANAPDFDSPFASLAAPLAASLALFDWTAATPPEFRGQSDHEMDADVMTTVVLNASALPPYTPLLSTCKEARSAVRDDCQRLGAHLYAASRNVLEAIMALRLIEESATADTDRAWVLRERRRLAWQQQQSAFLWQGRSGVSNDLRRFSQRVINEGELAALRDALDDNNLPLDPPADWISPAEANAAGEAKRAAAQASATK